MKLNYFLSLLFGFSLLSSCNSEDLIESEISNNINSYEDVVIVDSLLSIDNEKFASWTPNPKIEDAIQTRSSVTTTTLTGCTSQTGGGNYKRLIGPIWASALGIPNQIYIVENVTCYQTLTIKGLEDRTCFYSSAASPNCGFDPNDLAKRGYSDSRHGDVVTMVTIIAHIKSDMSGRNYDRWYPCKPSDLKWNYDLINLQ